MVTDLELKQDSQLIFSDYDELVTCAKACTRCGLCKTRTNVVVGDGSTKSRVMVVGEAPGQEEDMQGIPFVGRSGQLLTKLFQEVGIARSDLYITNVVKCRPPDNRNPASIEINQCKPYLFSQLEIIRPRIIVPVGNFAVRFILNTKEGITKLRGKTFERDNSIVVPTVHPAYVLRNGQKARDEMLNDLRVVAEILKG